MTCERCHGTGLVTLTLGGDGFGDRCSGTIDCDDQPCPVCEEWESYEEDGPLDLEVQLEYALDRAFP